ncbi:geranylgeranyl diphosphate synthase, putative [Talaromyces stipitatus ATCC 10500]|uniref:Geranylgeranyl diphosphate synthase, putative n=1 Tax=Talaromyces stipitatus (strain ATCC 10500 / CBS 375.48 / QM 6759 / NRRL 1006) TaxID=441959 RepID=B8MVD3_TALSN|nr:geranylgeranyl diphosphate synthase, putative [Talaromyces stipitatus ATCC 10500]EED11493.1 geranylgeranyl diphosphate synthase, putative [Talaromyces stipitatus ATCC 10500]
MEFKYSTVIDPTTYETHGLCDGIDLRCHESPELEEIETLRCQENWREWVGPLGFYKGGLGPRWNFMAITVPECLPERLGVLGYANELAFLHDDIHNDDLKAAFEEAASTGRIEGSTSGKRAIQAHIANEMMKIHKQHAITTLEAWAKFAELGSGRQHTTHFKTEKEYIKYRMIDIGTMFWYGMVTFGMGISVPEEELEMCHELANTAYLNLGLTNDLYSWQKEYETAVAMGRDYVANIIGVLMEERKVSEEVAKEICREKIKVTIVDFRKIVADTKARDDVSVDTKRYLEGLLYSLSGNLVWSIDCPRYHRWSSYNERQLDWMKNGIPKSPKDLPKFNGVSNGLANGTEKIVSNGHVNGNGAVHVPATNGVTNGNGATHTPVSNGTNGTTGLKDPFSLDVDTDLVNVFARKEYKAISAPKLHEGEGYPSALKLGPNGDVTIQKSPEIETRVIQAPYDYISSLPSKGVRDQAIDALNVWCRVPAAKVDRIKLVTNMLHNTSLMLDDMEDGSTLRRGKSSTHTIFGAGQTVNAANYQIIRALEEVQKLGDKESVMIFTEELKNLYIGQSLDLHWTNNVICPTVDEYFRMVEHKTGGLFRLFGRLLSLHSTNPVKADLTSLLDNFGRYYQTRDDYSNLTSPEYTTQKGFCEDLDEGKFSLPVIHMMLSAPSNTVIRNIWTRRLVNTQASLSHKQAILELMKKGGSLQFTEDALDVLHAQVEKNISDLEGKFGAQNFQLRLILEMLRKN